ncbi:hypothetical protein PPMP20_17880 [Paraburkholderia phymatum]|nr:hypothetical protein [Paraburkholderia phymatum]
MPGIALDSVAIFQRKVSTFSASYIADWRDWISTPPHAKPARLGKILRKWQACRPNTMRRDELSAGHEPPYLDDLIAQAAPHVEVLSTFDIAQFSPIGDRAYVLALDALWNVFEHLSYEGRARAGLAGSVGISKAVMLITDGRVGPAFDSEVRSALKIGKISNASEWQNALLRVSEDIQAFEKEAGLAFSTAKPPGFEALENGRVYDMALGPR